MIKYPGKIDIVRGDKILETLPIFEKNQEKKAQKPTGKSKQTNPLIKASMNNDFKELSELKTAEQNLETYSTIIVYLEQKVKKMIETK